MSAREVAVGLGHIVAGRGAREVARPAATLHRPPAARRRPEEDARSGEESSEWLSAVRAPSATPEDGARPAKAARRG
jgi:hypothetical protein